MTLTTQRVTYVFDGRRMIWIERERERKKKGDTRKAKSYTWGIRVGGRAAAAAATACASWGAGKQPIREQIDPKVSIQNAQSSPLCLPPCFICVFNTLSPPSIATIEIDNQFLNPFSSLPLSLSLSLWLSYQIPIIRLPKFHRHVIVLLSLQSRPSKRQLW